MSYVQKKEQYALSCLSLRVWYKNQTRVLKRLTNLTWKNHVKNVHIRSFTWQNCGHQLHSAFLAFRRVFFWLAIKHIHTANNSKLKVKNMFQFTNFKQVFKDEGENYTKPIVIPQVHINFYYGWAVCLSLLMAGCKMFKYFQLQGYMLLLLSLIDKNDSCTFLMIHSLWWMSKIIFRFKKKE